jgi:succinate dehydrogenase / fumarate reductase flavoprotein subunit
MHYNPGWNLAMDLPNILVLSRAIAMSALARKESRGGHTRADYPAYDPVFAKINHLIYKGENCKMELKTQPLLEPTAELKALMEEA